MAPAMTDKFRKNDAPLPSLTELLGERSDDGLDDDPADLPSTKDVISLFEESFPEKSEQRPSSVRPDQTSDAPSPGPPAPSGTPSRATPSADTEGGDDRDAFEPNWYRVLAAQAKVRENEGEDEESPAGERDGSQHAGGPGYPRR